MGLNNTDLTFTSSTRCTANAWNHIVSTYASGVKYTYVNTVVAASASGLTGTIPTGQTGQYIGAYGPGSSYFLNGRIGVTRVYNIALTSTQVLQNFDAMRGRYGI
jgi:hypothetical protein